MPKFLRDILAESISLSAIDDTVVIDYSDKKGDVKTTLGKRKLIPYTKKIEGTDLSVISMYNTYGNNATDIIKALKAKKLSTEDYHQFLSRSAVYASKLLKDNEIDIIVMPKSSSTLTKDFASELGKRFPHIKIMVDSFVKSEIDKIVLNTEDPRLEPSILKSLTGILKRAKKDGYFEFKKVLPQHRKFFRNVFSYDGNSAIFEDKNVLIVDDIIASGSSIYDIYKTLQEAAVNEVLCLTLFKTK